MAATEQPGLSLQGMADRFELERQNMMRQAASQPTGPVPATYGSHRRFQHYMMHARGPPVPLGSYGVQPFDGFPSGGLPYPMSQAEALSQFEQVGRRPLDQMTRRELLQRGQFLGRQWAWGAMNGVEPELLAEARALIEQQEAYERSKREAYDAEFNMAARNFGPGKVPRDAFALDSACTDPMVHKSLLGESITQEICVDKAGGAWGIHLINELGEIIVPETSRQLMPLIPLMTNDLISVIFPQGGTGAIVGNFTGWRKVLLDLICSNCELGEIHNNLPVLEPDLTRILRLHLGVLFAATQGKTVAIPDDMKVIPGPKVISQAEEDRLEAEVGKLIQQYKEVFRLRDTEQPCRIP